MKTINLNCSVCGVGFSRAMNQYKRQAKLSGTKYRPICNKDQCRKKLIRNGVPKVNVPCDNCNKFFTKRQSEIKDSDHNFCCRSCSAKYHNAKRKLSSDYKSVKCKYCNTMLTKQSHSVKTTCTDCAKKNAASKRKDKIKQSNCIMCGADCFYYSNVKKYCDPCRTMSLSERGKIIGKISASRQQRRSKNEIYFHDLCKSAFSNVTSNEPYFTSKKGNWDADVILHDYKIAVLWNGAWHYKQLNKKHSVKQVQTRDKIKIDVIKSHGYIPYIIKDMGRYDIKFVEQQFQIFKEWLTDIFIGYGI